MKKVKYPNLNDYDLSAYEELKGDVLYTINGGVTMSPEDQKNMAEAAKNGDNETQKEIIAKYEKKETPVTPPANTQTPPPATNTTPQQTTALTTEQQVEEAKKDADKKKKSGSSGSSSGNGSGSGSGNTNDGSSGSVGATQGNGSVNPYEGRKTSLNNEEQYEMARKDAGRKNGVVPTTVEADNTYCVNNYKETVKYTGGEQIKGQGLSPTAMEDLIRGRSNPFEGRDDALTPAEQAEMARQHAVIKKNTKETKVWIVRNDDGLGNEFNATRYIYKDGKLVYQDVVGANACKEDWTNKNADSTTPDGRYYLTDNSICLTKQSDGTANSSTYTNVLALMTNDTLVSPKDTNAINYGDRYFHANQRIIDTEGPYSLIHPCGTGCIIGQGGQNHQNEMMRVLMAGVYNPSSIQVNILSLCNMEVFKK